MYICINFCSQRNFLRVLLYMPYNLFTLFIFLVKSWEISKLTRFVNDISIRKKTTLNLWFCYIRVFKYIFSKHMQFSCIIILSECQICCSCRHFFMKITHKIIHACQKPTEFTFFLLRNTYKPNNHSKFVIWSFCISIIYM